MPCLGLRLTPHGHLLLERAEDMPNLDQAVATRLAEAFARGSGQGLLQLGAGEIGQALPPALAWWRGFAARYVTSLCLHTPDAAGDGVVPPAVPGIAAPDVADLSALAAAAPIIPGSEYLTPKLLLALWAEMEAAMSSGVAAAGTDLQGALKRLNPAWNLVGRVHFNLAENRRDPAFPFAFMATYATELSAQAKARHLPLGQALREYAGTANKSKLLSLLVRNRGRSPGAVVALGALA